MKEKNKKGNTTLIILVILLSLICLGMGGYIFINRSSENASTEKTDTTSESVKSNSVDSKTKNVVIGFDDSKSLNSSEKYTLSCQGNAGIWISVDPTQKELTFSFTPTKVVEFYSLNWTSNRTDVNSSVIKFEKKIVDLFF